MNNPLLIIPTYFGKQEHLELFDECIKTLRETTDADIICVDDCSPEHELYNRAREIASQNKIRFSRNEVNSGFATTVNVGLKQALEEKRDAVLVNMDMEFTQQNWLERLAATEADVAGALLLFPNGLVQHGGIFFSTLTRGFAHRFAFCFPTVPLVKEKCECPVTGALQYIKYETLEKYGIYDEEFFLGFEDVDYNLRVLIGGGKVIYNPDVIAIHHESIIRTNYKNEKQIESLRYIMTKYNGVDFKGLVPSTPKTLRLKDE